MKKPHSTWLVRLPASIKVEVERRAKANGISINQFVATAVAEKLAAMNTAAFSSVRCQRADFVAFDLIMHRNGGSGRGLRTCSSKTWCRGATFLAPTIALRFQSTSQIEHGRDPRLHVIEQGHGYTLDKGRTAGTPIDAFDLLDHDKPGCRGACERHSGTPWTIRSRDWAYHKKPGGRVEVRTRDDQRRAIFRLLPASLWIEIDPSPANGGGGGWSALDVC